jgi:3-(3-hydroxy-phenyl)propionate hydroxylase
VAARGSTASRGPVLSPEGRELRAERFEHLDTPYPFSISIQQRITERLLTEHLEQQGDRVDRGVELVALQQDTEAVSGLLRHDGGERAITT